MDLPLYVSVLWRHKGVLAAGFVLAIALAFLSVVKVSPSGKLSYRQQQKFVSYVTLLVSQEGFPWGRSTLTSSAGSSFADPSRFAELSIIYAHLAVSDDVIRIVKENGGLPLTDKILADPVIANDSSGSVLPFVQISAISTTPASAIGLARRETSSLLTYLRQQQVANQISPENRVVVTVVNAAEKSKLYAGRSKVPPIIAFVLVMVLTTGIAFTLENVRPRLGGARAEKPAAAPETSPLVGAPDAQRISA
jgi:capsular polysaccharide biosynthesis protein